MNPRLILSAAKLSATPNVDIEKVTDGFEEQLSGGKGAERCVDDFDFYALLKGMLVELEHTDDPMLALEITMDHLSEEKDPKDHDKKNYYDYLEGMEDQMKKDGIMKDDDEEEEEKEEEGEEEKDDDDEEEEVKVETEEPEKEPEESEEDLSMYDL